jgi:hypothetical protein
MRVIGPQKLRSVPGPPPALQRRLEFAHPLTVTIAGITMSMRFGDAAVRERFAHRYRHHIDNGNASIAFACGADGDNYYFWSEFAAWCWSEGPLPDEGVVLLADAAAMSALVRSDPGLISFHAAAVARGSAVAAIVGDSHAGKTTTALACVRRGMQVYSDERLLVRGETQVLPFLRAFNVRPHGASLLDRDGIDDSFATQLASRDGHGEWTDVSPFDFMQHLRIPAPGQLHAIFFLDGKAERVELRETAAVRCCPRLLESIDCSSLERFSRAARAIALLRGVRTYSLTLGPPNASAMAIEAVLRELSTDAA